MTVPSRVRADRAVGAVLGAAAGDALGAGYEFGPPLPDGAPVAMNGGGRFRWAPGEWTDDTQMALAVLGPLSRGSSSLADVEAGFRAWFASRPADVGNQTRAVLSRPGPLPVAAAAYQAAHPGSAGNGSLMRTGPVALAHLGDRLAVARLAAAVSALTHAHDDCVDACVLWSLAIEHAVTSAPTGEAPDWVAMIRPGLACLPADRRDRWSALIDEAATSSPRRFTNNGWVVHAFQAALASIVSTPVPAEQPCRHLQESLATAVRCGGDTDTVAAIAGSLLGAGWGATAVPIAWRRRLHGRVTYADPPQQAADVDGWARLSVNGGRPDGQGWPGVERMVPHYERYGPPVRHTIEDVTFGNAVAVPDVLAAGADSVISLCRMGTKDVPADREHVVVGLHDTDDEDNPNLAFVLTDTADAIADAVAAGRSVYVHCVAGEHRTPAVAAAYLVRHHGHDADAALAAVHRTFGRTPKPFLADAVAQLPAA